MRRGLQHRAHIPRGRQPERGRGDELVDGNRVSRGKAATSHPAGRRPTGARCSLRPSTPPPPPARTRASLRVGVGQPPGWRAAAPRPTPT
eukprot:3390045-Prymnesium_polylepis.1